MKKLLLFMLFIATVGYSGFYVFNSYGVFRRGVDLMSESKKLESGLAFVELVENYPYSPFLAASRLLVVAKDANYLNFLDLYYRAKGEKDHFESLMQRTPAYYDPYFFALIGYYLVITFIGVLQRFWVRSYGLKIKSIISRILFLVSMVFGYVVWVRDIWNPYSGLSQTVSPYLGTLNNPFGVTLFTVVCSALMTLVSFIATIIVVFGFFGKRD
ncbi:MAG: hypothetical protein MI748_12410 [Opitutales bacterium]|nr:hypothetical protein [Opitutales bacterium]